MSFCKNEEKASIFLSTQVENLFITEYMLKAPGDFVKVYILALMQSMYPDTADASMQRFAKTLEMESDRVEKAFAYWISKGLITKIDDCFELKNIRSAIYNQQEYHSEQSFLQVGIANRIAEETKGLRIDKSDMQLFFEIHEFCEFDDEAVILFIQYCKLHYLNKDKKSINTKNMQNLVSEWHKSSINTATKAREYILGLSLIKSEANKILRDLGVTRRNVTAEEHRLYEKWTSIWGIEHEAIEEACKRMSVTTNPNFGYLDKILGDMHKKQLLTKHAVVNQTSKDDTIKDRVQAVNRALGITGIVSAAQRQCYEKWTGQYMLDDDAILEACKEAQLRGIKSYKGVESFINSLVMQKVTTSAQIISRSKADSVARKVLSCCGIVRQPNDRDAMLVENWLKEFDLSLILFAAESASSARKPIEYIEKLLSVWKQKGIKSVEQAKADNQQFKANIEPAKGKTAKINYKQHEYADDELNQFTPY